MIDILLSTYNGKRFLEKQLDSILAQTYTEWRLLIRDDTSSDSTRAILEKYQQLNPQKIILFPNNINKNIGVIKSFENLLECSNKEYIMFCDQDDIWLPNKIEVTLNTMKDLEAKHSTQTPIAVHSDLTLIDENENEIPDCIESYYSENYGEEYDYDGDGDFDVDDYIAFIGDHDESGDFNDADLITFLDWYHWDFHYPFEEEAKLSDNYTEVTLTDEGTITITDEG